MMRKLRLISCLMVVIVCCSLGAQIADAASTFAADLSLYRTNNTLTLGASRELATYVAAERLFARSLKMIAPNAPLLVRSYLVTLDQVDSATRRIVRDQHTSDRLLADVLALAGGKRIDAAWILLKRGAEGQVRFMATIAQARLLAARCKAMHLQLVRLGG